jgi:OOP family OmpA-OmpF porin
MRSLRISTRRWVRAALWCTALTLAAPAQMRAQQLTDVKGSKDPAAIKRYEGSIIIGYKFSKFDEFTFMLGPIKRSEKGGAPTFAPAKTERVEGQYTRLVYTGPEGRSPLEVLRNYEQELTQAGFKPVYRCAAAECGEFVTDQYLYTMENRLDNYPPAGSGRPPGQVTEHAFSSTKDPRLLVAKRTGGAGDAWISVLVATGRFDMHKETFGHPIILVDLVESAAMDTKMVTVDASAMAKSIATEGHVALYGILFDTDKTDIKPESAATISEIAKFLKQNAAVKLYVVGHTDNVGLYDYNIGLSQRRAAAVVQELTTKHGIPAARLKPAGSGPLSPVAPNESEDGRAKNRRVELVKQ